MQEVGARSLVWELRSCMLWWGPKQFFFFNGRRLQMDNQRPTRWPCASCLCCPLLAYPRLVPANMLHAEPVPLSASVFLTPYPTPWPPPLFLSLLPLTLLPFLSSHQLALLLLPGKSLPSPLLMYRQPLTLFLKPPLSRVTFASPSPPLLDISYASRSNREYRCPQTGSRQGFQC